MTDAETTRLARLETSEAARDTLSRYCFAIDNDDLEAIAALFVQDAAIILPDGTRIGGLAGIMDFYRAALTAKVDQRKHFLTNPVVTHEGGDCARVDAYLLALDLDRGAMLLGWGKYRMQAVVLGGVGHIRELHIGLTQMMTPVQAMLEPQAPRLP